MKKNTRILALILSGLLIASSMVSCKKDDDKGSGAASGNGELEDVLEVPKGVAEGKTFSLYIGNPDVKDSYIAEEETGSDLNDAVYQRNQLVEEYTGATLEFTSSTRTSAGADQMEETSLIRTLIQSGDDTYDAFVHVQHSGMPTLIEEGMFVNWKEIPHIKLDNPWWYSNVERDISFGNKVYAMTGDYNYKSFALSECLIFNKTMCDELGLEYPYQMVFDGTWTHDRFLEYIKAATSDLNGDGQMTKTDDRYGFGGWAPEQVAALFCAYGGQNLAKDEYNMPVLNLDNALTYTVIDKMLEVFNSEGAFIEGNTYGTDDKMFNEGRLLFNDGFLSFVPNTRSLENIDVGFVPYPKLDETQTEYYTRTANISCLTYIPVTNADLDKTGAVLETLAYYSNTTVMPTYFDIILTIKSTRDVESEDMIPIIRNSSRFMDSNISFNYAQMMFSGQNTLASTIAANKDAWEEKIEDLVKTYSDSEEDTVA